MEHLQIIKVNEKELRLLIGKTLEDWETLYNVDELWDFKLEELLDGTIEINEDMTYWLIDGRCYEVPSVIKNKPYEMTIPFESPWDFLDWATIAAYGDSDEYYHLDEMYNQISEDTYSSKEEIDKLKKEYDERFGKFFAETLENVARSVKSGRIIFKTKF